MRRILLIIGIIAAVVGVSLIAAALAGAFNQQPEQNLDTPVAGDDRTCGQTCGGALGLCTGGASCTFASSAACGVNGAKYCVPTGTQTGGRGPIPGSTYERRQCPNGANNYLYNASSPNKEWTQAEVQALCASVSAPACGNGQVETGEQCDEGNQNASSGARCSNLCQLNPACNDGIDNDGDGKVDCQSGNQDPGCFPNGNGGGGACLTGDATEANVQSTTCGNGTVESGEECDRGANNANSGAVCSRFCTFNTQCNDGRDNDGDGKVDCQAGRQDPGCFPNGKGGGGNCSTADGIELDGALPDTGFFDENGGYLLVGLLLILVGIKLSLDLKSAGKGFLNSQVLNS